MMMFKSTKVNAVFFLGMLLLFLASCDDKTERTYELLPPNAEGEVDVTSLGKLSVNIENGSGVTGGEGSPKVVDGAADTKFLTNPFVDTMWIELNLLASQRVDAYTLTAANDAPTRDPRDWALKGSKDRVNWVTLDARTGEVFAARFQKNRYEFANEEKYKYYRLYITKHGGDQRFQLAEWRIISMPQQ
ncbi:discoidin domain-containing protein [Chitinophaga horti]|uniref:Discoidin domain-containing protein n=1 Tax=Chitinophaga horti TaxID=2920382 RepID=A0ABY6IX43_9BACT|nr:discoidin domain-containing protein [Chitinophaga horti]UYQ91958.1 discoidin domain-containing protein [Chitinophaga horti]